MQCCGGTVTVLLEPLPVVPAVAIFGVGHVGFELARILARHDIELHLVDTRPEQLDRRAAGAARRRGGAACTSTASRCCPEIVLGELPPGTHVLIMTHDHAEDAALCDAVLRGGDLGSIGLIGSAGKWARFQRDAGRGRPRHVVDRPDHARPIGLAEITGKEPATIAVSVAADLLLAFERERSAADGSATARG